MIKVEGTEVIRSGEVIGYVRGNAIYHRSGKKLGYIEGERIFDAEEHTLAWIEGDYIKMTGGKSVRLEDYTEDIIGATLSNAGRAAIRILLGN